MTHRSNRTRRGWQTAAAAVSAFVAFGALSAAHGPAQSNAPPAPRENPKRDLAAIKDARHKTGLLKLPDVVSEAETAHNARFDAFVAPVRKTAVSVDMAERLRRAAKASKTKAYAEARAIKAEMTDPIALRLVDWLVLREGGGDIADYIAFLEANPSWPNRWRLIEHMEAKLFEVQDADLALRAFKSIEPESAVGRVVLALAHARKGSAGKAREIVSEVWRKGDFSATSAKLFKDRLGDLLDAKDEAYRKTKRKRNNDDKWGKTRAKAYDALKSSQFRKAYEIARSLDNLTVNPRKDREFLAGWIALRYLGDSKAAIEHFSAMKNDADGPLSRSKSAYWLGRAHEAASNAAKAKAFYLEAFDKQSDTFHAHLARLRVDPDAAQIRIAPPETPPADAVERFRASDTVKATVMADKAGLGRNITRPFLANLGNLAESEGEVALVAHLARELGDTQQSLRIGKKGIAQGFNLVYYAYPLHAFPDYVPLREPPEPAFMLSIARQESEFNTQIVSSAGARGILQVMPITARHVCNDYNIRCDIKKLILDESYNTKISSAYIADRMEEFGGSYVLGLAGYNAGPGRARQWIGQFGDPRDARIDEIDWIERIPFAETRAYVGKVLSNIQMYRARLGEERPLRLLEDLMRAKPQRRAEKLYPPGAKGLRLTSGQ